MIVYTVMSRHGSLKIVDDNYLYGLGRKDGDKICWKCDKESVKPE